MLRIQLSKAAAADFHEKVVFVKPDVAGSGAAGQRR